MNLIGHREFGFNQTYFKYDETSLNALQINAPKGNLTFEYWLQSWINCYGWLLKNYPYNKNILQYLMKICAKIIILLKRY